MLFSYFQYYDSNAENLAGKYVFCNKMKSSAGQPAIAYVITATPLCLAGYWVNAQPETTVVLNVADAKTAVGRTTHYLFELCY